MATIYLKQRLHRAFGTVALICLSFICFGVSPAQARDDDVELTPLQQCYSDFPGAKWYCEAGFIGDQRGSVVFNDGSVHYTYLVQEDYDEVEFVDDMDEELSSRYSTDHASSALTMIVDNRGGVICDDVCGDRACLGVSYPTSVNSDTMFEELAGLTEYPDQAKCSVVSEPVLRAFLAAQAYGRALLDGGSENNQQAMLIPMVVDAFAILALSQEVGYDSSLVSMLHQARKIRGFKLGVQYYTPEAIEVAAEAAYDRFNRRTYTAHLVSYHDPDANDGRAWYCPYEKTLPRSISDYQAGTYYCVGDTVQELRPTEYSELIGYLQPPDLFEGGLFPAAKFSTDDWRRSGSDGYLMPRANHMTDQQLLDLAISLVEDLAPTDAALMKSQVYMGQVAVYEAHRRTEGDLGYSADLEMCPTTVDAGVFESVPADEMNLPDWLIHFHRYEAEYGTDITDPFFEKMTRGILEVIASCDVEQAPADCREAY